MLWITFQLPSYSALNLEPFSSDFVPQVRIDVIALFGYTYTVFFALQVPEQTS